MFSSCMLQEDPRESRNIESYKFFFSTNEAVGSRTPNGACSTCTMRTSIGTEPIRMVRPLWCGHYGVYNLA